MPLKSVLSIGQCCADHSSISSLLCKHFQVEVINADTSLDAFNLIKEKNFDLILVNRIFDCNGESGIEFISKFFKLDKPKIPIMLVSNFENAQNEAINFGAAPGFGKNALNSSDTLSKLKSYLEC
jgi:DNA-binding NarL/FixJ family response regulator